MDTRLPCRLRFSHEVTTGISHGLAPVAVSIAFRRYATVKTGNAKS
jgi:hypothetical protein